MVNGQWSMVNGQWSMVNGQWSMVNGHWSIVNRQSSIVNRQSSLVSAATSSQTLIHSSLIRFIHPLYFETCRSKSIFASDMGLLDLDKIIIKRTIIGIRCTSCGGNLVTAKKKSIAGHLVKLISFGAIKPKSFECENCKKRFLLL